MVPLTGRFSHSAKKAMAALRAKDGEIEATIASLARTTASQDSGPRCSEIESWPPPTHTHTHMYVYPYVYMCPSNSALAL